MNPDRASWCHFRALTLWSGPNASDQDRQQALQLWLHAANDLNHADSALYAAYFLEEGASGVPKDPQRAKQLYELAVAAGSVLAMISLGNLLLDGAEGVVKDAVRARELLERASSAGDINARFNLGHLLEEGAEGVPRDPVRARELYASAASAGQLQAMTSLGILLMKGTEGVARDVVGARELFESAVSAGHVKAMTNLGALLADGAEGVAPDAVRAKELWERAGNAGDFNALCNLGNLLRDGAEGIPQDALRAKELYERAASAGHVGAAYSLGKLLRIGAEGIVPDAVRAKELYERAASAGHVGAMTGLGILLAYGAKGVAPDVVRAKELYERAVSAGDANAMHALGLLLTAYEGVSQYPARAKELWERAASAGHSDAMTSLGNLLVTGAPGVWKDLARAIELYERAANAGNINAMTYLGDLLAYGHEDVKPDPERAKKLHEDARRHSSWKGYLRRAQVLSTGDEATSRNVSLASECFEKAAQIAVAPEDRAMVITEFARFLLAQEGETHYSSTQKAIDLLEEAANIHPYRETVSELINLYCHATAAQLRNAQRAAELKQTVPLRGYSYFKRNIVSYLERDGDAESRLIAVLQQAVVKPTSCVLLTLGAPGRGKTATLKSLRGLPFVSQRIPTEMLELSQFVTEPGLRGLNNEMLGDLDFRENSFRAVASRISANDMARFEREMNDYTIGSPTQSRSITTVAEEHRDVLERVRQSLTNSVILSKRNSEFLRCLDMGGQNEYEMAHSLFIARADILLFVVNLEKVFSDSTREQEVGALCYWMQLAYMLVRDPSEVRVIIVGTPKGLLADCTDSLELLRASLARQLGTNVYDEWVREKSGGLSGMLVGIENSRAIEDPKESGLESLDAVLKECVADVLKSRDPIPLRWLALVDKLRRIQGDKRVLWSKEEVEKVCKDFPGFPTDDSERKEELLQSLSEMTKLTGVASAVLFELNGDEWVLSVSPERVLEMFRRISGRLSWSRFLKQEEALELDRSGTLSESTLVTKIWGNGYEESEKRKMIDLLCECDLLLRLRDKDRRKESKEVLYGVPFLFKSELSILKTKRSDELVLEILTEFKDALPHGLQGGLMAYLSRTIHDGLQDVRMVGRNSTLLRLKRGRGIVGRVIVECKPVEREIVWTCIGRYPLQLAQVCVEELDGFLNHHAHRARVRRSNVIKHDCDEEEGCGKSGAIEVDFRYVCGGDFNHEVYCKECMVSRRVSELFGDPEMVHGDDGSLGNPQSCTLIPAELLEQTYARMLSSRAYFGDPAIQEACKGLSRVLELDNSDDIDCFGQQLQAKNPSACESNYESCWAEQIPCFAISYMQHSPKQGRFKFSEEQWRNLRRVLEILCKGGVKACRIWLDQCLWLRDAPQRSWAQTGVFPYILWPVIALGDKKFGTDRTLPTYDRMWPFVEEVGGLWSLGVITTSEQRGRRREDGCREYVSFNHRQMLEPQDSMRLLLLNIYHGATDELKTGWLEDVEELKEMAQWNLESGTDKLIVGLEWKLHIASGYVRRPLRPEMLLRMALKRKANEQSGEYLEGSRKLEGRGAWNGFAEWMSGNWILSNSNELTSQRDAFMRSLQKINVVTGSGEFQLLGLERSGSCLWLLVAMDRRRSYFSRQKVKRTKVVHGASSCVLKESSVPEVVAWVLSEQLGIAKNELNIISVKECSSEPIQWI